MPLDIASSLYTAIGTMYPSAQIKTDGAGFGDMVIVIDSDDRRPRMSKRALAAAKTTTEDPDNEPDLVGWKDGAMVMSTPEELSLELGGLCAHLLAAADESVNYMEFQVRYDGKPYVVAACRSVGQTPHALRRAAEKERDEALAEVERLRAELEEVRG